MKKLSIVVPAYNEELTIKDILNWIQGTSLESVGFEKEVIVVDDGSKDRTADLAESIPGVSVFRQERNQGKGAAVKRGISEVSGDYVLIQDADMEYFPDDYGKMVKFLEGPPKVAIYGSRILGQVEMGTGHPVFLGKHHKQGLGPWVMNRILSVFCLILYGRWITDLLTAYKIYPMQFLHDNPIQTHGFETDHELTAKLLRQGYEIKEVGIQFNPRSIDEGKKIRPIDGLIALWTLLKFRFVR